MRFAFPGGIFKKEGHAMDQETVIALCAIFTVVIGIVELTRK